MMMKALIFATALAASTPALGQTAILGNGQVVPALPPAGKSYGLPKIAPEKPRHSPTYRAAVRWEIAYQTLSVIDGIETHYCVNVKESCTEANPLFGKHPSLAKIIAVKAAGGALHYYLFSETLKKNPHTALRLAQISAGLQGAVVVLNARFVF